MELTAEEKQLHAQWVEAVKARTLAASRLDLTVRHKPDVNTNTLANLASDYAKADGRVQEVAVLFTRLRMLEDEVTRRRAVKRAYAQDADKWPGSDE